MKVKELVEQLLKRDQEAEVLIMDSEKWLTETNFVTTGYAYPPGREVINPNGDPFLYVIVR